MVQEPGLPAQYFSALASLSAVQSAIEKSRKFLPPALSDSPPITEARSSRFGGGLVGGLHHRETLIKELLDAHPEQLSLWSIKHRHKDLIRKLLGKQLARAPVRVNCRIHIIGHYTKTELWPAINAGPATTSPPYGGNSVAAAAGERTACFRRLAT